MTEKAHEYGDSKKAKTSTRGAFPIQVLCAGMRWSVPELGTNLGTKSDREKFPDGQMLEMNGGLGRD